MTDGLCVEWVCNDSAHIVCAWAGSRWKACVTSMENMSVPTTTIDAYIPHSPQPSEVKQTLG